ncbi:MAG: LPS export ABC transporter periplasmic protein LptC [Dokdonella sp.]|uniref:LPS export ABC transporter periplasmic protein LptC n=1 Tax=Dokdonella sp. TaxID=2291710 RepID=UPI0025BBB89C|nr:LPS export ABC transporter periplasmic protein LptC [Dokdonella sp.]MBX3701015.1 LPS export ABC transporter periplasmic protein LptC [Dokdonella sp.]MCW5578139.1 LPS export ABC transporter periplasmic protein LptC [Dokdonella sp.]
MERRYWLVLGVLAVSATLTQYLVWLNRDRTNAQTFAGPPRSDYTLTDFTLDALDTEGQRTFQVSGPALARRGDSDGSIYVASPQYLLVDGSGKPWHGRSDSAWVDKTGELMKLQGAVELHRAAEGTDGPLDITGHDLSAWPRERRVASDAAVTISEPGSILSGIGMRGDLNAKTLELLADVHAVVQPARKQAR